MSTPIATPWQRTQRQRPPADPDQHRHEGDSLSRQDRTDHRTRGVVKQRGARELQDEPRGIQPEKPEPVSRRPDQREQVTEEAQQPRYDCGSPQT